MSNGSSNIRVFIHWHDQTVFAGEDVKCTITFRNVAQDPNQQQQQQQQQEQQHHHHHHQQSQWGASHGRQQSLSDRLRFASPSQSRSKANVTSTPPLSNVPSGGHRRAAPSLSGSSTAMRSRTGSIQWHPPSSSGNSRPGHAHKRSVSIVSIASTNTIDDHLQRHDIPIRQHRSRHGHNRSSSLQISSWGVPVAPSTPQSGAVAQRHTSSPLANAPYPSDRLDRTKSASTPPRLTIAAQRLGSPRAPSYPIPEFRFPAASASDSEGPRSPKRGLNGLLSPRAGQSDSSVLFTRPKEHGMAERPALTTRILSSTSMAGATPRSSGEFYSLSNDSSETLVSEYVTQPLTRGHGRPNPRQGSLAAPASSKTSESLMMGFAQVQGAFTLDSSLVSLAPFDQVKKKAVVSGRGGGVVGIESSRRENNLLRSFGFGGITNSLGELLGGGELSTMKEMRGAANSRSVPILSTPQSILFVDLQLAPGESRAFEYTLRLPRGLPPSHKGKAIKISYSLVIGTQRAGGAKEQQVRTVEIPFRVLGGVDSHGEAPEHDLMNPYILLRDLAQVKTLGKGHKDHSERERHSPASSAGMQGFIAYVDELTTGPREETNGGRQSPATEAASRRPSVILDESAGVKEAIWVAITRSNMAAEGQQSPNRFEIARNGQRVGVVMLTRPAYRLGEVVTMAIDFADADIPCYAVHTTLESTERVEASLAIRSESSIERVTRKIYVSSSEATLYTRRVVFTPTIPISATPNFVTTGVVLEWKIRIEFVVPSSQGGEAKGEQPSTPYPLLELISQDDKGGQVLVAMENLVCESFDVVVPLRIYGAVGTGLERLERDEASEEGLVV